MSFTATDAPVSPDEAQRLKALQRYRVLDTLPEQAYEDIAELAAFIAGVPISLISLVDEDRQWFKAAHGLDVKETPRSQSFCAHTLNDAKTLIVEDAAKDARFAHNPLVEGDPNIRFYAGAPIVAKDGNVLGTVCVIDTVPRKLETRQIAALEALARQAMSLLEHRRSNVVQAELAELLKLEMAEQRRLETEVSALNRLQGFLLRLADEQRLVRDPRESLQIAARLVCDQLHADRVGFAEISADGGSMMLETGSARPPLQVLTGTLAITALGEGHAADLRRGITIAYRDVRLDPRADAAQYEAIGVRATIAVPLIRGGEWRGTLYVNSVQPRDWTVLEVELVQEVAERTIDVMERAQTEEVLRRRESQFKLAAEAADLATWYYDPEKQIVGGDRKMAQLFSLSTLEGPAEQWLAPICSSDRERVGREFAAAVEGEPYDTEYRVCQPDGSERWVRAKAQMLSEEGVSRLVGICEDVTRRKVVEEDLRQTAERLSLARQAGRLASWQWDLKSGTLIWDSGSEATYGRPPEEMTDVNRIFTFIHEEDRARVQADLAPALAAKDSFRSEFRVVWPDGAVHWNLGLGKAIVAADGTPTGLVGINMDITERKLAESALIQNEKLAAVGRLASSIAHEINNPLESVTNLIYLAKHSEEIGESRTFLQLADEELRRASAIANQTLRFHKQSTRPTEVTAEELIAGSLITYQSRLSNSGIHVEKRLETLRPILCFEGEIRQVVNNLIGNAIDAMPAGGRLLVRSREARDWKTGRDGMALTIADTGTGMSPQTMARVFEAFFTTKGIGGTGLGLWITKEILDRHRGSLKARSSQRPGCSGSVFNMFLPFDAAGR